LEGFYTRKARPINCVITEMAENLLENRSKSISRMLREDIFLAGGSSVSPLVKSPRMRYNWAELEIKKEVS
jgi:hypothetical protein